MLAQVREQWPAAADARPVLLMQAQAALLARVRGSDPAPRASFAQLLRAWWGEVLSAPLVFCWRQPFRSHAEPDHLPAAAQGRLGVVLVQPKGVETVRLTL